MALQITTVQCSFRTAVPSGRCPHGLLSTSHREAAANSANLPVLKHAAALELASNFPSKLAQRCGDSFAHTTWTGRNAFGNNSGIADARVHGDGISIPDYPADRLSRVDALSPAHQQLQTRTSRIEGLQNGSSPPALIHRR